VIEIPPQYKTADLADFPEHARIVAEWLGAELPGLLTFTGAAGTGKTRMLYAIARMCPNAKIYIVPMLCAETQRAAFMRPDAYTWAESHPIDMLIRHDAPVLLDDLGAEKTTDFVLQELYRLISQRELWGKAALITTNLSLAQLAQKLDDRIASRLAGGIVLEFSGADRRIANKRSRP